MKNPFGKTVTKENAHAVYSTGGWTWYVLKTYQTPEKAQTNKYARAYCLVTNAMFPKGELGDVYLSDITGPLIRGTDIRGPVHQLRNELDNIL